MDSLTDKHTDRRTQTDRLTYLFSRPLEQDELVTLVELLLAHRPELQDDVFLLQQLIQCSYSNDMVIHA